MNSGNQRIGDLVRRGILLFSGVAAIPAPALVAAVSAAAITKLLDIHQRRVTEILSAELTLPHISRVQPDDEQVALFFARNPVYPQLEQQFDEEIRAKNIRRLRDLYPLVHNALILQKQVPALLYHAEIEGKQYRKMALQYEQLVHGYKGIEGNPEIERVANHFAGELLEVLQDIYGAVKDELKDKKNRFAFDTIDYIIEVASL